MFVSSRNQNLSFYARKKLNELGVWQPNIQQIESMKDILTKTSVIVSELVFPPILTNQEVNCLYLAIQGKRTVEIAKELNISDSTVKTYKARVREKLNCKTSEQTVYECIRLNYVVPTDLTR